MKKKLSILKRKGSALSLLTIVIFLASCATQKSKDDLTPLQKLYHNTTSHYNAYFNANEIINESVYNLESAHTDNYSKLLEIHKYMGVDDVSSQAEQLDEAIKKASVAITLHRPSNWTDDAYLLIAKSQFIKKDYEKAEETLKFFKSEFDPLNTKSKFKSGKADKKDRRGNQVKERETFVSKEEEQDIKDEKKAREKEIKKRKKAKKKGKSKKKKQRPTQSAKEAPPVPTKKEIKEEKEKEEAKKEDDTKFKEDDPKSHRLCYNDGLLLLARNYIERERFGEADFILNRLEKDPKSDKILKKELYPTRANYYLKKKDYTKAITALRQAIQYSKDKPAKARYAFIIAQIYQMNKNGASALTAFNEVLKYKPNYEMEFNTKLNLEKNAWISGKESAASAIKKLEKMAKDLKNEEYRDQIYYTLGEIALESGQKKEAITYFEEAISYNVGNKAQLTECHVALGELHLEYEDYVKAQFHFESALTGLSKTDERYVEVKKYSENLKDIADNIKVINLQDSLLLISYMDDKSKKDLAKKIKADRFKEQEEKASGGAAGRATASSASSGGVVLGSSNFFAYNPREVKKGMREFEKVWGNRDLVDNWRTSRSAGAIRDDLAGDENFTDPNAIMTMAEVKQILRNVPETEQAQDAARAKIQKAMLNLGILYRDRLENYDKSVSILEELNDKYPSNKHELDSWYYLYLSNKDLGNGTRAQYYANLIQGEYADSDYAKILSDPNYAMDLLAKEKEVGAAYNIVYDLFDKGQYEEASTQIAAVTQNYGTSHPYVAKLALLNAMCIGNLQGKETYIKALKETIQKYPQTDVQTRAREILRFLEGDRTAFGGASGVGGESPNYRSEESSLHYALLILNNPKQVSINDTKISISNYHRKYHKLDKLAMASLSFNASSDNIVILIRKFKDKKVAMKYYDGVIKKKKQYVPSTADTDFFVISQQNYRELMKFKSVEAYRIFFNNDYLAEE